MGNETPRPGIALCLSGGGFRATLFHLGSLWRLNELGYLRKLTRICSVSGGSITAAVLGHNWKRLQFTQQGVCSNFVEEIAKPLREFCSRNIDVTSILDRTLLIFRGITAEYDKHLFNGATLRDLPTDAEGPRFIIYATNLQTGASFRFSKPYLGDYRLGLLKDPATPLSTAVAASSAFPPFLSPVVLQTNPDKWENAAGADLFSRAEWRRKIYLSDGGVYDNLGLEAAKNFETVLASDAGAPLNDAKHPLLLKLSQIKETRRTVSIAMEQARSLRKRHLIDEFKREVRKGTYWGIATDINDYHLSDAMVKDNDLTQSLQSIRTRLNRFSEKEQCTLINWGYALADAAMRKHVISGTVAIGTWPTPEYPLT